MEKLNRVLPWIARLGAAVILIMTLFYKFSGAPESKYIFSKIGAEPWGRIGSGVLELAAALLILVPRTTGYGALLGLGAMGGAILVHLTILGIAVNGDHGLLFIYAILVFVCCLYLVWTDRKSLPLLRNL